MILPDVRDMTERQRNRFIRNVVVPKRSVVRQCEHIKSNGEFCGSPALRGRNYCYFHLTLIGRRIRAERAHARAMARGADAAAVALELPPLEDADSIQVALMQITDAIVHNRIDTKRAGLLLYALQTASSNLARGADFSQTVGVPVAGGYDDFEEDFELEDVDGLTAEEQDDHDAVYEAEVAEVERCAAKYAGVDAAYKAEREKARQKSSGGDGTPSGNGEPVRASIPDSANSAAREADNSCPLPVVSCQSPSQGQGDRNEAGPSTSLRSARDDMDGVSEQGESEGEEVFEADDDVIRASYPCGRISQYFCMLHGPLARAEAGGPELPQRIEREARSQRMEVVGMAKEDAEERAA